MLLKWHPTPFELIKSKSASVSSLEKSKKKKVTVETAIKSVLVTASKEDLIALFIEEILQETTSLQGWIDITPIPA